MLTPTIDTIRLTLHVIAAAVWVGGQITLAGIVPGLRRSHPESTRTVAKGFARIAWTSFVLLVVTGLWNLTTVDIGGASWRYQLTAMIHVFLTVVAGLSAAAHSYGRSKIALALGGALGLLASIAALFVGVLLRSGN